jgi:predicted DNA-binding transcriptional regulator YafY
MSNTTGRMLRLISLLQTHRSWPGGELAGRLEVSQRTLRRDIDRLRDLGYPVAAVPGIGGGYQLEPGATLPPLLLDEDEAIAIAVALRTSAGGGVEGVEETSVRALAKVVRLMSPKLRARVDTIQAVAAPEPFRGGPTVSAAAIAILAQACQDRERLRFESTVRDGDTTTRLVEPERLVTLGRRWYLIAWDVDRDDWRTFRLDRLRDARSTRYRSTPREIPGGDPVAFVQAQIGSIPARYDVAIRIASPAHELRGAFGRWVDVEPESPTSSIMRMRVDALDWPVMIVAGLETPFEILAPTELLERVRATAATLARATATGAA